MTSDEYLKTLTDRSAWVFTKQDTRFDEAFKGTKLFAAACEIKDINVEDYFTQHHEEYGVETDRHRMLVIPQQFGLITKTPFYVKGAKYHEERPTEIFDLIANETIGSPLYNKIKTEQLLKIKIHSIIDTAGNNEDYYILPVIFIYQVLKKLQLKHKINEVPLDQFFTYIITCKTYKDLDLAVENIASGGAPSPFVSVYRDRSRILPLIHNNINLFNITKTSIAINPQFDSYFYNNFIRRYDIADLHEQLLRDVDYSYLLYNNQNFNLNLCDVPTEQEMTAAQTIVAAREEKTPTGKSYLDKVDAIKERNVNENVAKDAHKVAPTQNALHHKEIGRNPILGKIAIKKAYYACENDYKHETFKSNRTHKPYMEAHHLIPVAFQQEIWEKFHINVDCLENLVSLCPTCHKAFHFGTPEVRAMMVERLFQACAPKYRSIDFKITVDDIKKFYGIKE